MHAHCHRVTGILSHRQAAAAMFDVSTALATGDMPGRARALRWRRGFAVFVCLEGSCRPADNLPLDSIEDVRQHCA